MVQVKLTLTHIPAYITIFDLTEFEGYNFRRMVNEVEKTANKTDLAKKIIRILTRPPREEREKEKEKNKEKRSKGMPSNPGLPPDLLMVGCSL